jgi:uncharacterized protein (DUF58 family)
MDISSQLQESGLFPNLEFLAQQVVEGFISGIHKSPFHGFSAEFAEHKTYIPGESTKHIDWKLYAKTDKLYTKRFEEETNLRCHLIIDRSASMYYPEVKNLKFDTLHKMGFTVLAAAAIMNLLKKQRDAVGLSIFGDQFDFNVSEKSSDRHFQMILNQLNGLTQIPDPAKKTKTYEYLHQIAEKMHRRSLVFVFSDMLQTEVADELFFDALKHLKYNKHEVILFHLNDHDLELDFAFDNTPKKFIDVETGEQINIYADNVRDQYQKEIETYLKELRLVCGKYGIKYVNANIRDSFAHILNTFLMERKKMV